MRTIMLFIALISLCGPLCHAQDGTMNDLRMVAERLKALRNYSYETETNATFPGGRKDRKVTAVYMDGAGKRLCYKNDFQVLLLTGKWAYKADHRTKNISVFDVVKYNARYKKALPELEAVFKSNLAGTFIDSVVLRDGKLTAAKRKGNLTTYTVRFPEDYYVEEMVIVYDHQRQLPESIRIRSFFAGDATRSRARGTVSETFSHNYTTSVSPGAFDEGQYFHVTGGKVVLSQYKNYKITSIL